MNEQKTAKANLKSLESGEIEVAHETSSVAGTTSTNSKDKSLALSPEEQMALYEKELKENDWGHQPC